MNRRILLSLIIATLIPLGLTAHSSAHVLKIDGDIGAVLHINPDDNPTTGTPTDYVLSFVDSSKSFNLKECGCIVSIIKDDTVISATPLTITGGQVSDNRYTFATPGVYTMHIAGTPEQAGKFQPFTLDYEVRVTNGSMNTQPIPPLLWAGMGMGIGLVLLAAYAMDHNTATTKAIVKVKTRTKKR